MTFILLAALSICFGLRLKEEPSKLVMLWRSNLRNETVCNIICIINMYLTVLYKKGKGISKVMYKLCMCVLKLNKNNIHTGSLWILNQTCTKDNPSFLNKTYVRRITSAF